MLLRIFEITFFIAASVVEGTTGKAPSLLSWPVLAPWSMCDANSLQAMDLGIGRKSGSHSSQIGLGSYLASGRYWERTLPLHTLRCCAILSGLTLCSMQILSLQSLPGLQC